MAKAIYGFNSDFLPSSYYMPYIFEILNSPDDLNLLAHKGLQRLFFKGVRQPITIATSLGSVLYDNDYNQVDHEELCTVLKDTDFIIKSAHDSSMGRGVVNPMVSLWKQCLHSLTTDLLSPEWRYLRTRF